MTYEEEKEQATRQVAAHARAARDAEWPGKRVQHEESIRYLCDKYGIASPLAPPPERPPTYEFIKEEIRKLGFADALAMFWDAHQYQAQTEIGSGTGWTGETGQHQYGRAYHNMRKLAVAALVGHGRDHVWIPKCVGFGEPMQFEKVVPGTPKGSRDFFNQERYSK